MVARYKTDSLFAEEAEHAIACSHIIRVAFEVAADTEFDYLLPDEFWPTEPGRRVEVPFGRKNKIEKGFCVAADIKLDDSFAAPGRGRKLKTVIRVIDKKPLVDAGLMEMARWISSYYVCSLGQVLAAMVPAAVKKAWINMMVLLVTRYGRESMKVRRPRYFALQKK